MPSQIAPYGSWKSPITTDLITQGTVGLGSPWIEGDAIYWIESRPTEGGRQTLMRGRDGAATEITPAPFYLRTRVHEYGGGACAISGDAIYGSNFSDQRVYKLGGGEPVAITPTRDLRYADGDIDARRGLMFCIREDHTRGGEVVNEIVSLKLDGSDAESGGVVLVSGNDFYSNPRLSQNGKQLCWLTWNHPNMPWDGTELWMADVNDNSSLRNATKVAGGVDESIFQPEWSPDGRLYFVSDRTGWWNLYRVAGADIEALCPMEAEFGLPGWQFRMSTYAFASANTIICIYIANGAQHLATLNAETKELKNLDTSYTVFSSVQAADGVVVFSAGSPSLPTELVRLNLATGERTVIKQSNTSTVDEGYISTPEVLAFPTTNGLTAYGFYYPPHNQDFAAPNGAKPPLIVISHGGPTSSSSAGFNLNIQYWTSRGFGLLDVNYGGSTGYGRAYRQRLNGQWGIVDVDDCANGAKYLAERGDADSDRLIIRGGSAGGFTTLAALTFRDVFKAGASYYGISDLEALAKDTHKFESRYCDNLVGPYPAAQDVYVERSPIHYTHRLNCPMILFQGLEDKVVPPDQSKMMFEAVRAKELPVAYLAYEGEQHGFRKAATIKNTLESELYFYSKIFKFDLAESVAPIEIENLDD